MMDFAQRLIVWQKQHGRHDLPWQVEDPYCVWISEIMLQQTQVATVAEYYPRFIQAFPTVADLAQAQLDDVLRLWQGLGYYSRARNLHTASKQVMNEFGGQFPRTREQLQQLKGVGRSTAAAIASFAFGQRTSILDGNVKRVLCRVFAQTGAIDDKAFERQLWNFAESLLPAQANHMPAYTQGLMDLGATVCKRKPNCAICPFESDCLAKQRGLIEQLPHKRKAVQVKAQKMWWLWAQDEQGQTLLQKRANTGIWANLYCLPCFDEWADLQHFVAQHFGIEAVARLQLWGEIPHRLTHRALTILPYQLVCQQLPDVKHHVKLAQGQWQDYGLPKPLQQLLSQNGLDF